MIKSAFIARITGLGAYLPKKVLTNEDLTHMVETSDEWIVSRTGIRERRIAEKDEFPSDMGAKAAIEALHSAQLSVQNIDMILVATMTPDYLSPSTANLIQAKLGAEKAASMDVQAACSGFLYGLSIAKAYVESGMYANLLVIATEKMSAFMDYQDRGTCILFGDGAAAAVVSSQGEGLRIDTVDLGSDGQLSHLAHISGGGSRHPASYETIHERMHFFKMAGSEVFKHAVRRMGEACQRCLKKAELKEEAIKWLVPHQANQRIMDAVARSFQISDEKVYRTVEKYGNTSASSIAIALSELTQTQPIQEGDHLLLTAFGGGLTWGACILTKVLN